MKATGIVRRIDDLGRVVIPKEIRRTLRIRVGDPLEIFTDREWALIEVLLRNAEAFKYAEQLHRKNMQISGLKREIKELKESTTFKV